jgi:hypothetical protein
MYRFNVDQLYCLTDALHPPNFHCTCNQYLIPALEGVALVCMCYALVCMCYSCPGNMHNLAKCFDCPQLAISEIVNGFTALMDVRWAHILDFDPVLLLPDNLDKYTAAILDCRAPMWSIWGFLDCTI